MTDQELAIETLKRANRALERIFNLEGEEEETVQERADQTNPYLLTTKREGENE